MSSGMENLATGEGPVKREREEIKAVNNQGNSLPRKKFYRARAHCMVLLRGSNVYRYLMQNQKHLMFPPP